jgi:hypothetical protein
MQVSMPRVSPFTHSDIRSDIRSMLSFRPKSKCRCPPLLPNAHASNAFPSTLFHHFQLSSTHTSCSIYLFNLIPYYLSTFSHPLTGNLYPYRSHLSNTVLLTSLLWLLHIPSHILAMSTVCIYLTILTLERSPRETESHMLLHHMCLSTYVMIGKLDNYSIVTIK